MHWYLKLTFKMVFLTKAHKTQLIELLTLIVPLMTYRKKNKAIMENIRFLNQNPISKYLLSGWIISVAEAITVN